MSRPSDWWVVFRGALDDFPGQLGKLRYAHGEGSLWEVGLNLLGVIPGARLLGAAGKLIGRSAQGARAVSRGSRTLTTGRTALTRMTAGLANGAVTVYRRGLSRASTRGSAPGPC